MTLIRTPFQAMASALSPAPGLIDYHIPAAIPSDEITTYRTGRIVVSELSFKVPLDYASNSGDTITLFARAAVQCDKPVAETSAKDAPLNSPKPWIVYLEGGPGFGCPSPLTHPIVTRMTEYRCLFLDYRGTGLSTPLSYETLQGKDDAEKAAYLRLFRQDNIVRDLEAIRQYLFAGVPKGEKAQWSIFGQSFGGFVSMTYLSAYPKSLREVFLTGGLAPIGESPDAVYKATFLRAIDRNQAFYKKFPGDASKVHQICSFLEKQGGVALPEGGNLTVSRFLTLGISFGQHGGIDKVHGIITRTFQDLEVFGFISKPSLSTIERETQFDLNIIYAILHEAIYCDGPGSVSNWAAYRVGSEIRQFSWLKSNSISAFSASDPPYFSAEMMFPSHFDTTPDMKSLFNVAEELATYSQWPHLYDLKRLANNTVPIYAASYVDDLYVDSALARNTAKNVGSCLVYETNAAYHNGLRAKADVIIDALQQLRMSTLD
ncbi:Proline iminopeptidase [Ceratocystis lukuohia]|uniref:Proline iminopeptidase n=1 Tax=Ceratocystis lukuohia TaxID=2019550 RepID=A0ABR4MS82_9PEZI